MKFSCIKENLAQGFNVVSRITTKNINLPILNNVLINIQNKNLRLQTTNLEIFITYNVRAKIDKEGSFTLPAKLISDYVNLLPEERVDVELVDGNFIKVECENFKTKIKGISASEFPLTPEIAKENVLEVNVNDFKELIEKVIFAVAPNEVRPELNGVFLKFETKEKKLTAAATDSYRLTECKINFGGHKGELNEKGVIVPVKTLQEIHRIFSLLSEVPESSNNLEIVLSDNQITFVYDNVEILSRLIEGGYPEYQHIIPSDFKTTVTIERDKIMKAVRVASLFTKTNLNDIHLEFSPRGTSSEEGKESGEMIVSSAESQIGENNTVLNTEMSGGKNKIILNYKYLNDGLNIIDSEKIKIQMNDDLTPCVIRGVEGGEDYLYLVMPIKL